MGLGWKKWPGPRAPGLPPQASLVQQLARPGDPAGPGEEAEDRVGAGHAGEAVGPDGGDAAGARGGGGAEVISQIFRILPYFPHLHIFPHVSVSFRTVQPTIKHCPVLRDSLPVAFVLRPT